MLEQIFRNINDIRIFDVMVNFPEKDVTDDLGAVDIYEIMDILEYNEYKRIEVEDSIEHLVKNEILGIKKTKMEGRTGCKICKWTDKFKIPRIGEHKSHKPEKVDVGEIDSYYMRENDLTQLLRAVTSQHIMMTLEKNRNKNSY